jgi:S-adenosylmethionine decarboxylase
VSSETGCEFVVDATGCDPKQLASLEALQSLADRIIADLRLHPIGRMQWHVFDGPGGITGLQMLAESHLTLHTFPERAYAAFNLYHCTAQPTWSWDAGLRDTLGAREVSVRKLKRGVARTVASERKARVI